MASAGKTIFNTGGHGKPASVGLLLARIAAGGLMFVAHGLPKALDYASISPSFVDPFKLTSKTSLMVVIAAECVAALFVLLGLATRIAAIPLALHAGISAVYVQIIQQKADLHAPELEVMCLYTGLFLLIGLAGPGRFSVDQTLSK